MFENYPVHTVSNLRLRYSKSQVNNFIAINRLPLSASELLKSCNTPDRRSLLNPSLERILVSRAMLEKMSVYYRPKGVSPRIGSGDILKRYTSQPYVTSSL